MEPAECVQLIELQRSILERIALGKPRCGTLEELCRLIEGVVPGALATVMLLDDRRERLNFAAAPNVPPDVLAWFDGVRPGLGRGTCAAVVTLERPVFVTDTLTDPHWQDIRDSAEKVGLRACWSIPIRCTESSVIGTFAISHRQPCAPTRFHARVLETASYLAGIACESAHSMDELSRAMSLVQQSQKLEGLGLLAGGLAHDVNNLLTGIVGNSELARRKLDREHAAQSLLDRIDAAAGRCADLCSKILAFAGLAELRREPTDVNAVVCETLELAKSTIACTARIDTALDRELPLVMVDGVQVTQVVLNLVLNACDAMGDDRGTVRVRTGIAHRDDPWLVKTAPGLALQADDNVFIEVADDGVGMTDDVRARIFDPFFSTKGAGRGLGMSVVHGIVKAHGGAIAVESRVGVGTRIRVVLPIGTPGPQSRATAVPAASSATAVLPQAVLVVDDEAVTRDLAHECLSAIGIDSLLAANAREALELLARDRRRVSAVLLDVSMPDLPGELVFDRIRELAPDLPIVVCSGLGDAELRERFADRKPFGFLHKPFRIDDFEQLLQGAIASTLERPQ